MLLSMYFTANDTLLEGAFCYKADAELSPPSGKAERRALAARKKAYLDGLPGKLGLDVMGGEGGQGRLGLIQVGCHDEFILVVDRGLCASNLWQCGAPSSTFTVIPASTQVIALLATPRAALAMT